MQPEYRIIIKNDRYGQVKLFRIVFFAVLAIIFILAAYYENSLVQFLWPALLCFNIFFTLNRADFMRYRLFRATAFPEFGFLWAIAGAWFLLPWWTILLVLLVAILQFFIKEQYLVMVNKESLRINMPSSKLIPWKVLQNVVIKDDLLTIDYKNNKVLQAEIIPPLSNIGNEQDFNEFCRLQLQGHTERPGHL